MKKYIFILVVALLSLPLMSVGQNLPERGLVRKGNRQFNKGRYDNSSELYQRALLYDSTAFEARYNLGNSLLRRAMADTLAHQNPQSAEAKMVAGYVAQAEGLLQKASADSLRNDADRSDAYYNLGNTQFVQQKLQDALQSYRRSLVLNPDDMEAKYNYALTKKLLEQNQQIIRTKIRTRTSRIKIRIRMAMVRTIIRTTTSSRSRIRIRIKTRSRIRVERMSRSRTPAAKTRMMVRMTLRSRRARPHPAAE